MVSWFVNDQTLSPRENQVVQLASEGHTNESIASLLGLSVNTVNTYWVRIRMKTKADSKSSVVTRLIREKAEQALRESNIEKAQLAREIDQRQAVLLDLRAALSLLQLAMDQLRSAVWATDRDLRISIIANGEIPHFHKDMAWEVGNTIYEVFATEDREHPVVAAHLMALRSISTETKVSHHSDLLLVSVRPLQEDDGSIIGCIGVMASLRGDK